jgi:hypothetical protein
MNTEMSTPTPRTNRAWNTLGDDNAEAAWSLARTLERELATLTAERDQLRALLIYADQILDDIDTWSDAHKAMYSSYSQNVFKLCIKGRDARRAALAATEDKPHE